MAQLQMRSDDTSLWEEKFGNGSDGALTISSNTAFSAPNTICSGTSGSKTLSVSDATGFSVNDLIVIHQSRNGGSGAGAWQLNKISNISGVTFTLKYDLTNTYDTTSQVIKLYQYSSITIDGSMTWSAPAWDGTKGGIVAALCSGDTTINGTISASGSNAKLREFSGGGQTSPDNGGGYRGGYSNVSINSFGGQGEGTSGASGTASSAANGNGGGAGGGNGQYNAGGGGGNGTAGSAGTGSSATNGTAGAVAGNAGLTNMVFGGGGGGATGTAGSAQSSGANGGGIIFIASKNLTLSGSVVSNGGSFSGSNYPDSGGAGAGGSVLLKTQVATLGSSKIMASGGTITNANSQKGGAGGAGRIHLDYLTSYSGTTAPTIDVRQDTSLTVSSSGNTGAAFFFSMF